MSSTSAQRVAYAPWATRVLAHLLDLIWALPGAVLYLLGLYMVRNVVGQPAMRLLLVQIGLTFTFAGWGYTRWFLGGKGASWGKQRLGLRLISVDEQPINVVRVVLRDLAHIADALPLGIGYLWPLWDAERATFADRIVRTRVVRS